MIKFYSLSSPRRGEESPVGDPVRVVRIVRYDEFGSPTLIESSRYSQYDVIQSYKDECDLNKILLRYANGDVYALNRAQGMYGDVVGYPDTIPAAYAAMSRLEVLYNGLEEGLRAHFESFDDFVRSCGDLVAHGLDVSASSSDAQVGRTTAQAQVSEVVDNG